eukprot:gene29037-32238_t
MPGAQISVFVPRPAATRSAPALKYPSTLRQRGLSMGLGAEEVLVELDAIQKACATSPWARSRFKECMLKVAEGEPKKIFKKTKAQAPIASSGPPALSRQAAMLPKSSEDDRSQNETLERLQKREQHKKEKTEKKEERKLKKSLKIARNEVKFVWRPDREEYLVDAIEKAKSSSGKLDTANTNANTNSIANSNANSDANGQCQ